MASVPARGRSEQRPPLPHRGAPGARRTWQDCRLDLVEGRSDAPRIPASQVDRLHPWGAPRSWELLVQSPQRPPWVLRAAAGSVSVVLGVATVVSTTAASAAAGVLAGAGDVLAAGAHLLGAVGAGGHFGAAGRLVTAVAIGVPLVRIGWRLARWGAAPIGDDR